MLDLLSKIDLAREKIFALRSLDAGHLRGIQDYFRVGLSWASNALEGNTLSESETRIILEDGLTVCGKPLRDHLEAIGHAEAFDFLFTLIQSQTFSEAEILWLHKLFYQKIDPQNAGKYRESMVIISGSRYPVAQPASIPEKIQIFFLEQESHKGNMHPAILSAKIHKDFVFIHPFIDGNGRVARLLMNLVLLQNGYLPAVIPPVVRAEYIAALESAHTDDTHFIQFILRMIHQTHLDYFRLLSGN